MTKLEKLLPQKKEETHDKTGNNVCLWAEIRAYNKAISNCLSALQGKVILVEDIDNQEILEELKSHENCRHEIDDKEVLARSITKYLKGLGYGS